MKQGSCITEATLIEIGVNPTWPIEANRTQSNSIMWLGTIIEHNRTLTKIVEQSNAIERWLGSIAFDKVHFSSMGRQSQKMIDVGWHSIETGGGKAKSGEIQVIRGSLQCQFHIIGSIHSICMDYCNHIWKLKIAGVNWNLYNPYCSLYIFNDFYIVRLVRLGSELEHNQTHTQFF